MRTSCLLPSVLFLTGITSAWPWPPRLSDFKALAGLDNIISRRQNDAVNNNDNSQQASDAMSASPIASLVSSPIRTPAPSETVRESSLARPTSGKAASGTITARPTNTEAIINNGYPGGVNILKPDTQFGGSQYYAISAGVDSTVTWVWNYTNLAKPPAHIDVVATMSSSANGNNQPPFTLASNLTFAKTQTFTWDTGDFAKTSAMADGIYTLNIFDAALAGGATAVPKSGGLVPFRSWDFGVYNPAPNIVLEGFPCITCNAAGAKMEKLVWTTLIGVVGITMGTMAWFTGAAGLC